MDCKVSYHLDNAMSHTYLQSRQELLQLSWDVLRRALYLPDIVASDFRLFQSLQHCLNEVSIITNTYVNEETTKLLSELYFVISQ